MRKAGVLLAGLVTAAVVAAPVAAFTRADHGRDTGPVKFDGGRNANAAASMVAKVDQLVVFGGNVVRNTGEEPATLTGGRLTEPVRGPGAHVVEIRALDPAHKDNELIGAARWPVDDYRALSRPLAGYVLDPGEVAEVLYVVKLDRPGGWQWRTSQVDYTTGGRDYQARTGYGFMACAPVTFDCAPDLE